MNQHALLESTYRLNVARQIDEICDDYEARLLECEDIELIEYIDRIEEPHREQLCVELVHVRLEHSDATSEEDSIDSILSKLPEEIRESVRKRLETSAKKPKSHSPNSPTKVDCLVDDATVPEIPGFEVGQRVAEGGMGIIWKAKDLTLGRTVAVKVIKAKAARDPAFVQRFIDEVKIAGQLSHPFIVPIHALGQLADGRHYFTMKLVEGQTLSSLIRQFDERDSDAPGPHLELLLIFQKVCETMAFAHRKGILHRDLKPHNIMVGRHGEVQVMDWGLAGTLNSPRVHSSSEPKRSSIVHFSGPEKAALTRMGDILGTLAYMAPEQARGLNSGLDGRTDVFSLGAILCEILTGKPPYSSSDPTEVEHAAVSGDLEECLNRLENCHVDPQLIAIAKCCLSVQKRDRPGNAGIVAEMISGYLNSVEERAREERLEIERLQVQKREDANRRVLRRRYAAIAGLLLVFLGALSTHTWHQHRSRQERASSAIEETKSLISTGDYSNAKARLTSAKTEFGSTDEFESLQAALHLAGQLDTIRNDYFSWHDGWFDCFTAIEQYQIAFQEHQFPVELLSSTTADLTPFVQAVERSPVRERILNALDDWAWLAHREAQRSEMPQRDDYFSFRNNLLEIAIRSDAPSSIRSKLRNHQMWDYPQSLVEIARELDPSTLAPEQLVLTAKLLPADDRRNLLLRSQRVWPRDLWINTELGRLSLETVHQSIPERHPFGCYPAAKAFLNSSDVPAEIHQEANASVGFYRAALAVAKPESRIGYRLDLAAALALTGDLEASLAECELALGLARRSSSESKPLLSEAHHMLGLCLRRRGELDEAIESLQFASKSDPACLAIGWSLAEAMKEAGRDGERQSVLRSLLSASDDETIVNFLERELDVTTTADESTSDNHQR